MKKLSLKILITIILLLSMIIDNNAQTRIAMITGVELNTLSSEQLDGNGVSLSFGFSSHLPIIKNFEFTSEIGYNRSTYSLVDKNLSEGYITDITSPDYSFHKIYTNALIDCSIFNQKNNDYGFSLLAGFGTSVFNKWKTKNDYFPNQNKKPFKPYYIAGVSFSFLRGKISLRYNKSLGNFIADSYAYSTDNTDKINLSGKNNSIGFSFNYYIYN